MPPRPMRSTTRYLPIVAGTCRRALSSALTSAIVIGAAVRGQRRPRIGRIPFRFRGRTASMALLKITDAGGRQSECTLSTDGVCTIGRAADNTCVLDDSQASRHHAHIVYRDGGFVLVDGSRVGGEVKRSTNHVFVNGEQRAEH